MTKEIQDNKILLCITGGSPQVVTETLYCLITQEPPYIPTHIIIVSTTKGINDARRQLEAIDSEEDKYKGKSIMEEFCEVMQNELQGKKYSEKNRNIEYHTLTRKDGSELNDILSTADSEEVADDIFNLIKEKCLIEDVDNKIKQSLHVSIAGGRKTMGFYAGYSLSLVGRANEKLSHVLIESEYKDGTEPSIFENNPSFYFPKQIRTVKITDPKTKEVIKEVSANKAKLALTEIPIVKIRSILPEDTSSFLKNITFKDFVERTQRAIDKDSYELSFDMAKKDLIFGKVNDVRIHLVPRHFATFLASIKYFFEIKERNKFTFDIDFFKIYCPLYTAIHDCKGYECNFKDCMEVETGKPLPSFYLDHKDFGNAFSANIAIITDLFNKNLYKMECEYFNFDKEDKEENNIPYYKFNIDPKHIKANTTWGFLDEKFYN